MSDSGKGVWLTYNGEIYNFCELRTELEGLGHSFNSSSDTEVIIYAYKQWGIECIKKFNGMFAFAIWDSHRNLLYIGRDRYGIKPLYYYLDDEIFIFSSEISAILASGNVKAVVDIEALNEYFTFQNIFTDRTLFRGIKLLPPGSYIEVRPRAESQKVTIHKYWDYHFTNSCSRISRRDAAEELRRLFIQGVNRQLVSDVPVGSYLSGGIDTSSITAIACRKFGRVSTFTCGFDLSSATGLELGYDERQEAEFMANLFKTEHYEVVLHAGDMEAVMPDLIKHLEDLRVGQCYPNYYSAKLAGKFVKVVLSGAGGDELFGGYPWRYYCGINSTDFETYLKNYYSYWQRLVKDEDKPELFRPEISDAIVGKSTFDTFSSVFKQNEFNCTCNDDYVNASMYFEIKTFLHGLLLVDDKISMAHSLEMRLPFMDNDLVDFAMTIPASYKLNTMDQSVAVDENEPGKRIKYFEATRDGKRILREAMKGIIPEQVVERKKQGFSAPDASWFRGESVDYVKNLLLNPKSRIFEYLNPAFVQKRMDEHVSGKANNRLLIWSLLSFEWWNRIFIK